MNTNDFKSDVVALRALLGIREHTDSSANVITFPGKEKRSAKRKRRPSYVAQKARVIEGWFKISRGILKGRMLPAIGDCNYASITNKLRDGLRGAVEADGIEVRPSALWPYHAAVLWLVNKDEPHGDVESNARCAVLDFIDWVTATGAGGTLADAEARVECAKELSKDVNDEGDPVLVDIVKSLYVDMLEFSIDQLRSVAPDGG